MTAALTPELALAYVRELSADVRDGVVCDAVGKVLAGTPSLAAAPPSASRISERSEQHRMTVECGPHALAEVVRRDLRTVLASLDSAV